MNQWEIITGIVLILVLWLFSVIETSVNQLSRLGLKVLAEKQSARKYALLQRIAEDRRAFLRPIQMTSQLILVVLSMIALSVALRMELQTPILAAFLAMFMIVLGFRQLSPYMVVYGKAEAVLLKLLPGFRFLYGFLCKATWPILFVFRRIQSGTRHRPVEEDDEEASDEEIQAYLGVGEEEGIFESAESDLIQSALEFGNTLVREIMTPRSEISAIEEGASCAELRELVVSSKHSRIPVYRDGIDHIIGMVYVRNLLAHLNGGTDSGSIAPIIGDILIVPETKRVYDLLKEMQAKAEQIAIVVNEYGTVSGLVTIEDLLEEIVGEIRDEDEFHRVDLVYEGDGNYIVRGGVEIGELEETIGVRFGEHDAATVSGLVVDHLGSVPTQGEVVNIDGIRIQVLNSDRKRIHTVRVGPLKATVEENRPGGAERA